MPHATGKGKKREGVEAELSGASEKRSEEKAGGSDSVQRPAEVVDPVAEDLHFFVGCITDQSRLYVNGRTFRVELKELDKSEAGRVEYFKGIIAIDPTKVRTREALVEVLLHELFHVWCFGSSITKLSNEAACDNVAAFIMSLALANSNLLRLTPYSIYRETLNGEQYV